MADSNEISIGERLTSARKKKRLRYKKLSSELNIEESYLIALEEENYNIIPGGEAYVKGFLRSYSKKLDLDPDEIIARYTDLNYNSRKEREKNSSKESFKVSSKHIKTLSIILFLVVITSSAYFFQTESGQPIENISSDEALSENKQLVTEETKDFSIDQVKVKEFSKPPNIKSDNKIPDIMEAESTVSANKPTLNIEVYDDCWLEVFSKKERLLYKLAKSGDKFNFSADQIKLIAGNYKNVRVSFNDKIIELEMYANVNQVSCVVLPLGECSEFRTKNN